MATDTETLRREFEAACQREPLNYWCFRYEWHEGQYINNSTQATFAGFCAGRQASQAEIERLRSLMIEAADFWNHYRILNDYAQEDEDPEAYVLLERMRQAGKGKCYPTREQAEAAKGGT